MFKTRQAHVALVAAEAERCRGIRRRTPALAELAHRRGDGERVGPSRRPKPRREAHRAADVDVARILPKDRIEILNFWI